MSVPGADSERGSDEPVPETGTDGYAGRTFEQVWAVAESIPGWLTEDQARLLYDCAVALRPQAELLEIGSHQGRSTVVLGAAAAAVGGVVIAMDPFVEGRLFGGTPTRTKFEQNIARAGVADRVQLLAAYSTEARRTWEAGLDYLYIDGKHDYWTFTDDLLWRAFLPANAPILVHDAFSSIGVTLGILAKVLFAKDMTYLGRTGSMARFELRPPSAADRARVLGELPWWIRNVGVKVLLRLRMRPLARLIGHDSPYDPY